MGPKEQLTAAARPATGTLLLIAVAARRGYSLHMAHLQESPLVNWMDCPLIEVIPGKVSGVPLLRGTRLPADTILENYEGGSPVEEISENFDTPENIIREILSYAAKQQHPRRSGCEY